jgi:hypothetical protein
MKKSLIAAYNNTTFRIGLPDEEVLLHPLSQCPNLDRFLAKNRWGYAAVITAFNPKSVERSKEQNDRANHLLEKRILSDGYQYFFGAGEGDDPDWPPEDSFLICGIDMKSALKLAEEFGQYAIAFHTKGRETTIELTEIK